MSNENLFDGISRILAGGMSRRRVFRLIVGALTSGGAMLALEPRANAGCGGTSCTCSGVFACCLTTSCFSVVDTGLCPCLGGTPGSGTMLRPRLLHLRPNLHKQHVL